MIIKQPTLYSQICEYISEKKIRLSAPGHKGNVHFKATDMFKTDIAPNSTVLIELLNGELAITIQ